MCLVIKVLLSLTRWGNPTELWMEEKLGTVATLLTTVGLGVSIDEGEEVRHHTLLGMIGNPLTENGMSFFITLCSDRHVLMHTHNVMHKSCAHTNAHLIHAHTHSQSHTVIHTMCTHIHAKHTFTCTLTHARTHTRTCLHALSLTHTHTHIHGRTHTEDMLP